VGSKGMDTASSQISPSEGVCQSTNYDQKCPNISGQSNRDRLWVVRRASVNCSANRDIPSYLYGYVRDRKVISAIACRRADAITMGARVSPHQVQTGVSLCNP
jgi:hypothetical protein